MTIEIRDLKRRYKMNLALGRTLPTFDLAVPLPLSTVFNSLLKCDIG